MSRCLFVRLSSSDTCYFGLHVYACHIVYRNSNHHTGLFHRTKLNCGNKKNEREKDEQNDKQREREQWMSIICML
jgi:hypothetical protein